jgi:phosphoenolpyruvate carboxylase
VRLIHRLLLLALLCSPSSSRGDDARQRELRRFDHVLATSPRTSRVAATSVLTEHPSSLRLFKLHIGRLRRLVASTPSTDRLMRFIEQPLMTTDKQVREFSRLSLERGVATAKMIDYEGKPMPPAVIGRYVRAIERAGMRPGIEGDRFLLLRLPGAAEKSEKDQTLRRQVFEGIVDTNLRRVLAGKDLPVDRLIVPDTKRVDELMEVHSTYDRVAAAAVDRAIAQRKLAAPRRAEVLRKLCRVQAVPLVEDASTVMHADAMVKDYLAQHRARYGETPKHLVVFVAGSDLNRELGPVGGQLARTVMRSRLARLQRSIPEVDLVPWVGIGSGPMRSGLGRFPEKYGMVHPGMTATIQPDQLDQKNLESAVRALGRSALDRRPPVLSAAAEDKLIAMGAIFTDVHARLSLRNALPTVRLANLLAPLDQRGRKKSSANLFYEKEGEVYLRSVQPKEATDGTTYGRTLDVTTYVDCLPTGCARDARRLMDRQRTIDKLWPKGLSDPRAIPGAFARYIEGDSLTTAAGLGEALRQVEQRYGRRELGRVRPFVTLLVRNDGFVLTKDRALVRQRLTALHPELTPAQLNVRVGRYFADIAALERFLGRPIEQLISTTDRTRYETASRKLYSNPHFVKYLQGGDISLRQWLKVMDDLLPLLSNPSWNRIGLAPTSDDATTRLA